MSRFLKRVAPIALPIIGTLAAPGIGTALGSTLSGAALSGIGGALGGGLGGAIGGGGLSGALKGAALGGLGGYLSNGGFSDLFGSTSLSTPGGGFSGGSDAATSAARSAISGGATSAAPASSTLSGYLPTTSASSAGGGTAGGFFSGGGATFGGSPILSDPWAAASAPSGLAGNFAAGLSKATPSFFDNPLAYVGDKLTTGASNMFSTSNLIPGALKTGLAYALQKDNSGGYGAVQNAANAAGANYAPFLNTGTAASKTLSDLYGLNGNDAAATATQNWQNTPGYKFALQQGIDAVNASDAAKGMAISGNNQRSIQQYGSGLADQYYQQYLQNLQNQINPGVVAAQGSGQGGIDAATAYMLSKANQNNNYNRLVSGLAGYF